MTVERKVTVGLGDIKAVIFECRTCHTRVSIPGEDVKIPHACPCGKQWTPDYMESASTLKNPYAKFCIALNQCRTLQANETPFTILLEFDAPEFEDKS
jgi:hypothetical protein